VSKIGRLTVLLFVWLAGCSSSELVEMRIVRIWPDMERGDWLQQTTQTFYPNTIVEDLETGERFRIPGTPIGKVGETVKIRRYHLRGLY
jgi:hypothetical protein